MKTIVPDDWKIPVQIRKRFGESAGRQRVMTADGHLVLVLHEPPGPDDLDRKSILLWRNPEGQWAWSTNGDTTHLLKRHIASFTGICEQLEDQLQEASCASDYFSLLQATAPLHRTCRNLHSTLQQARDAVPDDHELIVARDAASDLERAFELLHTDAKNGLDFMVAQKAEQQSQRAYEMAVSAHRLNVLAALFFPITAISSVFGMNLVSGLEFLSGAAMFWTVLIVGLGSGVLLARAIADRPMPETSSAQTERASDKRSKVALKTTKTRTQKLAG